MMLTDLALAQLCYEANRAYSVAIGETPGASWVTLLQASRDVITRDVASARSAEGPADRHEAWLGDRLLSGWTFGTVADDVAKTTPYLLPYSLLTDDQRGRDKLFLAIVKALS